MVNDNNPIGIAFKGKADLIDLLKNVCKEQRNICANSIDHADKDTIRNTGEPNFDKYFPEN